MEEIIKKLKSIEKVIKDSKDEYEKKIEEVNTNYDKKLDDVVFNQNRKVAKLRKLEKEQAILNGTITENGLEGKITDSEISKFENDIVEFGIDKEKLNKEYDEQIKAAREEYEKGKEEVQKETQELDNEKNELLKKYEIELTGYDDEQKDKALKKMTMDKMKLEKELSNKEFERQAILHEISNFEFERDENNNIINGDKQKELFDKSHKIIDEQSEIKEAIELSEKYIEDIKNDNNAAIIINAVLGISKEKQEPAKQEPTKAEPQKVEPAKAEPQKVEPTKVEPQKVEPTKVDTSTIIVPEPVKSKVDEKTQMSEEDKIAMAEMMKTARIEKEAEKKDINNIEVEPNVFVLQYREGDKLLTSPAFYNKDEREGKLKKVLKEINPDIDFETEKGKAELKKYEKVDLNIVNILKENPKRLNEYVDLLNGAIEQDTEDENALKITYDIRKLNNVAKKERKEVENIAYLHRDIADVKTNLFQKIKFAFRDFKELFAKSNNQKLLTAGSEKKVVINTENEIDEETKAAIAKGVEKKHAERNTETRSFKEEFKVPLEVSKQLDEISKSDSSDVKELNFQDKYDLDK